MAISDNSSKLARITELEKQMGSRDHFPEGCAEVARLYQELGMWRLAALWWGNASGASIGFNRRARYEQAQKVCEDKARAADRQAGRAE